MDRYDVVIIGAGSTGAYLAKHLALRGHSVLVIEKLPKTKVGTKYDIFHIEAREFERLGIPRPVRGDAAWAFEFEKNYNADPLTLYPKCQINHIVGLHMHEYTLLLNAEAEAAGAKILYSCEFEDFLYDEQGKICGVTAKYRGREKQIEARLTADCSGMAAVGRTRLPADYGVENAPLTDEDMFYVILRYVTLADPKDYLEGSTFYTRSPYAMVADGFFVSGDAGSLTKSVNGEGVTSSMVHVQLSVNTLDRALKLNKTTRDYMWEINKKYNASQGAEFAMLRALLVGVVNAAGFDEFQYAFESGIISDELLNAMNGAPVPAKTILTALKGFVCGVANKRLRVSTLKAAGRALKNAVEISSLYKKFPSAPAGYAAWAAKADAVYERIGKIR